MLIFTLNPMEAFTRPQNLKNICVFVWEIRPLGMVGSLSDADFHTKSIGSILKAVVPQKHFLFFENPFYWDGNESIRC